MRRRHGGDKARFFGGRFSGIGACADGMTAAVCAVHARRRDDARSRAGRRPSSPAGRRTMLGVMCFGARRGRAPRTAVFKNSDTRRKDAVAKIRTRANFSTHRPARPFFCVRCCDFYAVSMNPIIRPQPGRPHADGARRRRKRRGGLEGVLGPSTPRFTGRPSSVTGSSRLTFRAERRTRSRGECDEQAGLVAVALAAALAVLFPAASAGAVGDGFPSRGRIFGGLSSNAGIQQRLVEAARPYAVLAQQKWPVCPHRRHRL